ncbi:MAG: cell division protein ZapA [Clostridiales Family XIII bacterium]|jgi:cell division protein ZapA|nr:cell division protein ZapA [Clostridiales Family XIII bacterium]
MEKVKVKIYGQEYTISGDKPQAYIERVADYVDEKMRQVSNIFPGGAVSALTALAAVNIADELFSAELAAQEVKSKNDQLENDTQHYAQLWEEAKKSFLQYKDEAQHAGDEKQELQGRFDAAQEEASGLRRTLLDLEKRLRALEQANEDMANRLRDQSDGQSDAESKIRDLEEKNKEIESGFFDLQMENIQLKGEIERYRKNAE